MRKQSPGTAAPHDVEDGVEDLAWVVETRTSGGFGSGKVGLQAAPFGIRQIGLICFSHARYPTERAPQNPFSDSFKAKFGKEYRTGSLARIEVFGLLHAVLERKAGESFFCRAGAEPCPLLFGDPEGGFYPRFPLWCPREEVLRFLVEALGIHQFILTQGAWPRS